jgi:hypothetical protein
VKPLLHSGEEYGNDLNHNCIPFHPRRSRARVTCWLDNLGEMVMKPNPDLALAAFMAMASTSIHAPSLGTVSNPKRFRHPSEIEGDKKRAQRAEIAKWNAEWEARKTK